jgi:hypothetical protein
VYGLSSQRETEHSPKGALRLLPWNFSAEGFRVGVGRYYQANKRYT